MESTGAFDAFASNPDVKQSLRRRAPRHTEAFNGIASFMKPKRTKQIIGIVIGSSLLVASPIVARMLYLSGMNRAFDTLGAPGLADPKRLSADIGFVLNASAGGLAGAVIGLVILVMSIQWFVRLGRVPVPSSAAPSATIVRE
jgi:hypothetical protein